MILASESPRRRELSRRHRRSVPRGPVGGRRNSPPRRISFAVRPPGRSRQGGGGGEAAPVVLRPVGGHDRGRGRPDPRKAPGPRGGEADALAPRRPRAQGVHGDLPPLPRARLPGPRYGGDPGAIPPPHGGGDRGLRPHGGVRRQGRGVRGAGGGDAAHRPGRGVVLERGGPSDDPRRGDARAGAADPGHAERPVLVRLRGSERDEPSGIASGRGCAARGTCGVGAGPDRGRRATVGPAGRFREADRGFEDPAARAGPRGARGGVVGVRRKLRPGGGGEDPGAPRRRMAPDRASAGEQGSQGGRPVLLDPDGGFRQAAPRDLALRRGVREDVARS